MIVVVGLSEPETPVIVTVFVPVVAVLLAVHVRGLGPVAGAYPYDGRETVYSTTLSKSAGISSNHGVAEALGDMKRSFQIDNLGLGDFEVRRSPTTTPQQLLRLAGAESVTANKEMTVAKKGVYQLRAERRLSRERKNGERRLGVA